jgi:hypothetical protein
MLEPIKRTIPASTASTAFFVNYPEMGEFINCDKVIWSTPKEADEILEWIFRAVTQYHSTLVFRMLSLLLLPPIGIIDITLFFS